MNSIIPAGRGSLRSASGASMIRMTARLRERGIAPIAEAAATSLTVCPCFLIDILINAGAGTTLHEEENEVEALID